MKSKHAVIATFLVVGLAFAGFVGTASARGGYHGAGPYGGQGWNISPEVRETYQKAHASMAPMFLELQAKKQELAAKIYGGADDATVKQLVSEVNALQTKLTEAGAALQQDLVKAGVPMHPGMMQCSVFGSGFHGAKGGYYGRGGYGHGGGHGHGGYGYGRGGYGYHGWGDCPAMMNMDRPQPQ